MRAEETAKTRCSLDLGQAGMVRHRSVQAGLRSAQAGHRLVRVGLHTVRVEHWAVDAIPAEFPGCDDVILHG